MSLIVSGCQVQYKSTSTIRKKAVPMSKKGKCQQAAVKGNALMHWLCRSNSQNSIMSVRNDINEVTHLISDITTVTSPSNSSMQHAKELAEIVNSSEEETGVNENIMTEAVTIQLDKSDNMSVEKEMTSVMYHGTLVNRLSHPSLQTKECAEIVSISEEETGLKLNKTSKAESTQSDKSDMSDMRIFHHAGQRYIRCEPCYQHPNIVRIHSKNRKVPAISLKDGTRYRALILADHLKTSMHIATRKAFRQTSLTQAELLEKTPIGRCISDANLTLANKIGGLMLHVCTSAKKLTMSAQTLPARYVAGKLAESFNFNATDKEPPSIDFQYTNPTCIRELMAAIVKSDRDTFACHLKSCLALFLRCDGSVDRSQIDKIYVMAKTVSVDGIANLFFLGVAEPEERGAQGLFSAVKHACSSTMGTSDATDLFCHSSSIVTDGANVNKGDKNGLWVLLDNDRKQAFEAKHLTHPPLLKVWCTVHRSQLAWKAVTQCVTESRTLISEMASISTYFHASAVRTRELKEIAKKNDCSILKLPKHYDIRWTEYTASLVTSILISWNALVLYMRESREKEAAGYLRVLTNKANLEVLSFHFLKVPTTASE
jgi:oligoribonuclease (3'-5' exoribonuclease)